MWTAQYRGLLLVIRYLINQHRLRQAKKSQAGTKENMWIAAKVNEYRLITRADYEYANQAQKEKHCSSR